jgi:hypothetical protein
VDAENFSRDMISFDDLADFANGDVRWVNWMLQDESCVFRVQRQGYRLIDQWDAIFDEATADVIETLFRNASV